MKSSIKFCFLMLVLAILFTHNIYAQNYISRGPYTIHYNQPKISTDYVTDYNVGSGRVFTGTIHYSDGVVTRYEGKIKDSESNEYHGVFNPHFGVYSQNGSYLFVPAAKDVAIKYQLRDGEYYETARYNIKGRSWYTMGSALYYADTDNGGGSYNSGSSSSSSSYNSHEATCRGCNGSGRCQHCNGSGWVNNYKSKCSLCHGNGTCVSCHGKGKIHGNF